jgi:NAD(P)-dependent dehydrogenase (short-subunit alcohol dehydrogenase family)
MKTVLVTGANKGIGYATCLLLLRDHPDIRVLLGSRDEARGRSAVDSLQAQVPGASDRIGLLVIDVSSPDSIVQAAAQVEGPMFGIVNNAAVGHGRSLEATLATNYYGVRNVTAAFLPKLVRPGGRIVNVGSGAGPIFISTLPEDDDYVRDPLVEPWRLLQGGGDGGGGTAMDALDRLASSYRVKDDGPDAWASYAFSKALLASYTYLLSRQHPDLVVNSVSPGLIKTEMSDAMSLNATKPPEEGAVPILHCLLSETVASSPQGRYYGSDGLRSPFHAQRNPGSPEYDGPEG